jgi:hypothetical protein
MSPEPTPEPTPPTQQQAKEKTTAQADTQAKPPAVKPARKLARQKKAPAKEPAGCGDHSKQDRAALRNKTMAADEGPVPEKEGPQPKLVCNTKTVKAEPAWAGKMVSFEFEIKNAGEANLRIKAKGG